MSRTFEFLNECGIYYLATSQENSPSLRPFGAIMEIGDEIYFSTSNEKKVYSQLALNPNVEIVALKPKSPEWIRVSGKAVEVNDSVMKSTLMETRPNLRKIFGSAENPALAIFRITEMKSWVNSNNTAARLD